MTQQGGKPAGGSDGQKCRGDLSGQRRHRRWICTAPSGMAGARCGSPDSCCWKTAKAASCRSWTSGFEPRRTSHAGTGKFQFASQFLFTFRFLYAMIRKIQIDLFGSNSNRNQENSMFNKPGFCSRIRLRQLYFLLLVLEK